MLVKKKLLQDYLNRDGYHRDKYHDMMPFKVKEILLVSNLYDSFFIEREGRFSEIMLYDYGNMNLTSVPRISGVTTEKEALEQLNSKNIDMVVMMVGMNKQTPISISKKIKSLYPDLHIFYLVNSVSDIHFFEKEQKRKYFDELFIWNGESRIFFAMIKSLEDKINVRNDTEVAKVRLILIVEDSAEYYSAFLTHLYQIIYKQTNEIINEVSTDNLYKVLKLRARPKVIFAKTYERAMELFSEYQEYIFCLISDIQFDQNGKINENAGFELLDEIHKLKPNLPCIMLSTEQKMSAKASKYGITFIDKNSQNLYKKLKYSVTQKIGFGEFVFKDNNERVIATAKTIRDFEKALRTVSDDCILFHAENNHFSLWLMARAEINLAQILKERKVSEFESASSIRKFLIDAIKAYRDEKPSGQVIPFSEKNFEDEDNINYLSKGSFGGKGRGLTFIHSLKNRLDLGASVEGLKIRLPKTSLVGTEEFEYFLEHNGFNSFREMPPQYELVKQLFLNASLSPDLIEKLEKLLDHYKKPLAIRSSGLFEDSISQPFAGIFETYILTNNHEDKNVRLHQVCQAIKLVYACVFSEKTVNYKKALDQKLGEEKMAIVIQELVGNQFENVYYPHLSGVAQSYNFYPFADMKPDEGFAVAAIGLGAYVVEGEIAYRFSPKYPKTTFLSFEDQIKYTQTAFYAVDLTNPQVDLLNGEHANLIKLPVTAAKEHGSLTHCVSVYDANNKTMHAGLSGSGPIVVNFANILKNNYVPLAQSIDEVLQLLKYAFGSPVEIEFAVDLNIDQDGDATFYILQVKPLLKPIQNFKFDLKSIEKKSSIIYAEKAMGNGLITHIQDLIYVKPDAFNNLQTESIALEIDKLNQKMMKEKKEYVLVGPGRWGTRDKWIGIPVNWSQISNAKVIVETELEGFHLDASYGSHFFHNLTSMNIAYMSVFHDQSNSFINQKLINKTPVIEETEYCRHVRFANPLSIKLDGTKRIALISFGE